MKRLSLCLTVLFTLLASSALFAGQGGTFPAAGIDLVTHELKIGLYDIADDGSDGEMLEELTFKGRMLLERTDPYTNADGFRQIDFVVKEWEAYSYSKVLDTLVTYSLNQGQPQRLSHITSQFRDRDFPARFYFAVRFDAIAFGERFFEGHEGAPVDAEFMEVPPSGNRRTSPTIWGFEDARIEMDHPQHGRLRFIPHNCNDTSGETLAVFGRDVGERTLPLSR
ncbi:MAG: hypothetical protein AAGC60_30595 [Acidobacteriota bacterium]